VGLSEHDYAVTTGPQDALRNRPEFSKDRKKLLGVRGIGDNRVNGLIPYARSRFHNITVQQFVVLAGQGMSLRECLGFLCFAPDDAEVSAFAFDVPRFAENRCLTPRENFLWFLLR
jgi:hypothetical protein